LIAKDDKIYKKGSYSKLALAWAQIGSKRGGGSFTLFIEEGKIKLDGDASLPDKISVSGAPHNDEYSSAMGRMNAYYNQLPALREKLKNGDDSNPEYKKAMAAIEAIYDSVTWFRHQYAKYHPSSVASAMFVYLLQDKLPVEELERLYTALHDEVKGLDILSRLPERIAAKKNTIVGKPAPSFTMVDTEGKPVSFSSFKGKYVLLEFWASWCVPCRKDNPHLVKAYQQFKDKNFTIISVSLDDKGEKWKEAIQKDGLTWVHISDLSGMNNPVAKLYGVQPIPDNFLIDPSGTIIARGLRGEELEKKLKETIR
jgi:peroxiredoxin